MKPSVKVEAEPHPEPPYERCCFCRAPTPYWVINADVACCRECAKRAHPGDVPSKDEWCTRERIADHAYRDEGWRSPGPAASRASRGGR